MHAGRSLTITILVGVVASLAAPSATAQIRIVQYNTATAQNPGTQTARAGSDIVLQAIGNENYGGVQRPIDVLALEEQYTTAISTQSFVNVMNGLYGAGVYARSSLDGLTSDSLRRAGAPALVYNTQTVQLIGETMFGNVGTNDGLDSMGNPDPGEIAQQPRSAMRYQLRPVGYDASADFYVYVDHYKSDTGTAENNRRLVEGQAVRANADALGQGVHIVYAGDYNIQSSTGTMYQHLLSAGNGQAFDPINKPGTWSSVSSFTAIHTQSPASSSQFSGQTLGGLDDRFDFQLVSGEMLDNEGLSYINNTYRAFGNNGTAGCCNNPITAGTGYTPTILNALMTITDHLPVVADYQLPAMMSVQVASIPSTVTLGASIPINVTIENIAPTTTIFGADELDYTLSVTGDLFGGAMGIDTVLGGGALHQITLNTATPGLKSGTITVSSSSQQAANALFTLPVSFTVLGSFLSADFNNDSSVNAADLAAWTTNFGLLSGAVKSQGDADVDGDVDGADLLSWQNQLGSPPPPNTIVQSTVPEPTAWSLALAAWGLIGVSRRTRQSRISAGGR